MVVVMVIAVRGLCGPALPRFRTKVTPSQIVTLGLDPRALHLQMPKEAQGPRVKPEGDARWVQPYPNTPTIAPSISSTASR
jgi:hypothetical protein